MGVVTGEDVPEKAGPVLGRPRVGTRVEFRLPDEVLAEVNRRAEAAGVSRSRMLVELVSSAVG